MTAADWLTLSAVPQAMLQQQLHNSKANEGMLQAELASSRKQLQDGAKQLQQLQSELQQVRQEAASAAEAVAASHEGLLQQMQQQLSSNAARQVRGALSLMISLRSCVLIWHPASCGMDPTSLWLCADCCACAAA